MRVALRSLLRLLAGLAFVVPFVPAHAEVLQPLAAAGAASSPAPWHVVGLPRQTKPFTRFSVVDLDGHRGVRIEAESSYGNLVHPLAGEAAGHIAWQWRVERPLENADLSQKTGDDSEVKVCVFFDEPMDKLSFPERQLMKVARARSVDPVPTATVCYVWDAHLAAGTAVDNSYTRRVRYLVLQSGNARLDQWVGERRDLRADFTKLFGDECDFVPAVVGVAIGADADNTHGHSIAYVGQLVLEP